MAVDGCAIYFWRKGLPGVEMQGRVDYMVRWDVANTLAGFRNAVSNAAQVFLHEVVYRSISTEKCRRGGHDLPRKMLH